LISEIVFIKAPANDRQAEQVHETR
jgi:hypothetical protein